MRETFLRTMKTLRRELRRATKIPITNARWMKGWVRYESTRSSALMVSASPPRLGVHAARGLIEDQELGLADQRLRDEDSLGLAAGQPADPPAPEVVDVQQRQDLLRLLAFATRHTPERAGPSRPAEEDRLQDRGREIGVGGLGPLGNTSETPEAFGT